MEKMEGEPSAKPQLKDLVLLEAEDWFNLGLQLDLPPARLNDIEKNNPRDASTCRRKMFELWLRVSPSASYQQLAEAYRRLGETDMVNKIEEDHAKISTTSFQPITKHCASQQASIPQQYQEQIAMQRISTESRNTFKKRNVLPSEDWPPSIGRQESNLVLIEHGRGTLPGVKDAKQMQKDYVGGKVDTIAERKKEISYEDIFDFSTAIENSEEATYASKHFTEEQIKECIRRNIPDKHKAEELIQKLKQRLDIFSMCYTPLNMAIVLYIYKQKEYQLPTTLTQLYSLYVLHTLKRSVENHFKDLDPDDVTNLKCLPDPIQHPFKELCEMAYNGLEMGYNSNQLPQSLQSSSGCTGTNPELLGSMSGSKTFSSSGKSISYQFTHLTIQEFLAAWHAATSLSAEELSKLFIKKIGDDRFRMMLLFLSGITGLHDTQVYQQIVSNLNTTLFFLAHLIYESRNASLSHILASSVQQDGKLTLGFRFLDLFQCTVLTYFLSTSNYPWTHLKLMNLTDQQVEVMQQVSCELAGSSEERGERPALNDEPTLLLQNDIQELMLDYLFIDYSHLPRETSFSSLLNMKQLKTLVVEVIPPDGVGPSSSHESGGATTDQVKKFATAMENSLTMLFKALAHNATLQKLEIRNNGNAHYILRKNCKVGEPLRDMLKANTSLKYLILSSLGLNNPSATHIAAGLAYNHSLDKLDISKNRITSEGAASIFKALENNNTLETLDMSYNEMSTKDFADVLSHNHKTKLTKVKMDDKRKDSIMAALVELRSQEGHTEQPDPVVSRCEQVIECDSD